MSHVETDPRVCQCSCHEHPRGSRARTLHNVACCVGKCSICHKRYTTEEGLEACRERHNQRYRDSYGEDLPEMPW